MLKNLLKIVCPILAAVAVVGCGSYNKVLKGNDNELKYATAMKYMDAGKYQKAATLLEDIRFVYTGTAREDSVAYYHGLAYYKMGNFDMSAVLFDDFRKTFGRSPFIEEAEYMYAKGFYYQSPAPNRDQTPTHQALVAIDEYLGRYPNSVKRESLLENMMALMQKLHDKSYLNAKSYYTTERYKSAVVALKNAVNEFPESNHREEMMYLTVKSSYLLADNSVATLQRDRFMDMMDSYYNFVSEYPESKHTKEINKMQEGAKKYLARHGEPEDLEKN